MDQRPAALRPARRSRCFAAPCLALALVLSLALASSGCAGSAEDGRLQLETGPDAEVTPDGLVRAKGSGFRDVWVKPDIDLTGYDKLIIGEVRLAYKRKPDARRSSMSGANFALDAGQIKALKDLLRETLTEQIEESEAWTLATAAGPDVLLLEPGLIDLVVKTPTDAPPNATVYTTSTAEMTLLLEIRDSTTEELLARVADRREARQPGAGSQQLYWSNAVTNRSALRTMFKRWSRILMDRLDTAHRAFSSPPAPADPTA